MGYLIGSAECGGWLRGTRLQTLQLWAKWQWRPRNADPGQNLQRIPDESPTRAISQRADKNPAAMLRQMLISIVRVERSVGSYKQPISDAVIRCPSVPFPRLILITIRATLTHFVLYIFFFFKDVLQKHRLESLNIPKSIRPMLKWCTLSSEEFDRVVLSRANSISDFFFHSDWNCNWIAAPAPEVALAVNKKI